MSELKIILIYCAPEQDAQGLTNFGKAQAEKSASILVWECLGVIDRFSQTSGTAVYETAQIIAKNLGIQMDRINKIEFDTSSREAVIVSVKKILTEMAQVKNNSTAIIVVETCPGLKPGEAKRFFVPPNSDEPLDAGIVPMPPR